jgi:copper chaperone
MSVESPFRTQVTVIGMTCQHCVAAVTEEISGINGVDAVEVGLDDGAVTVVADRAVARGEIAAAVTEAGYDVAD